MARVINFRKEEQQEWCPRCKELIGYMPEEEQVRYTNWTWADRIFWDKEYRFKIHYIICPNCGEMINLTSFKQFRKKGSNLYD